ncbi:SDR family NAD(P)-dependent oxidoreductase [Planctomycetota bacterium]
MELNTTTAVITGSSGNLGGSVALALAEGVCNCVCQYNTNKEKAEQIVETIEKAGSRAMAVAADLTKAEQIESLFETALKIGTPQILINAASVFSRLPLSEITFTEGRKILDINLTAAIMTAKAFAKRIKEKFGQAENVLGKIINISDIAGIRPWADYVLYCSSKAALIGATKALAKELAPAVCVNSVAPGLVTPPSGFCEEDKKRQLSFIPLRRKAEPKEIADAVIFLIKNDYITGQVLNVDGGRCI